MVAPLCPSCVLEMLRLWLSKPPTQPQHGIWYQQWADMPEDEKQQLIRLAREYMGWSEYVIEVPD